MMFASVTTAERLRSPKCARFADQAGEDGAQQRVKSDAEVAERRAEGHEVEQAAPEPVEPSDACSRKGWIRQVHSSA